MKIDDVKLGDLVCVTVLDHYQTDGEDVGRELPTFDVVGRLLEVEPTRITLACWYEREAPVDHNTEVFMLIRSAITKFRRLKPCG